MKHQVLLYYKYIRIDDPVGLMHEQRAWCEELNLKGRIILAQEGINGTVEGNMKNTREYMRRMKKDVRFKDIHWKKSIGTGNAFPKLSVKARSEIVSGHLGEEDIDPTKTTGQYLQPKELRQWFQSGKEFYIVDMRNDYEHKVGHFDNSILPAFENFRDLRKVLPTIDHLKDKTILTVCTGGVRCEKASGFLVHHGFTDVYQLAGGIVSYMEKYPNAEFKGALYVFDNRIVMGINMDSAEHVVVGNCEKCSTPCERYVNCSNLMCHKHFLCCEQCSREDGSAICSEQCGLVLAAAH
jgi:UPF0176 protein